MDSEKIELVVSEEATEQLEEAAEIAGAISDVVEETADEIREETEAALEEHAETVTEEIDEAKGEMEQWLENLTGVMAEMLSPIAEKVTAMESRQARMEQQMEAALLPTNLSEPIISNETLPETPSSEQTESPESGAGESLAALPEEIAEAPAEAVESVSKAAREIVKL